MDFICPQERTFWIDTFQKGSGSREGDLQANMKQTEFDCPVEAAILLIGGKYKPLILWHLREGALHYMELQRRIPRATPKMLSQQLRGLESDGLIDREVIPEKPPKTKYSLTPFGRSSLPVIDAMCDWGAAYMDGPGS